MNGARFEIRARRWIGLAVGSVVALSLVVTAPALVVAQEATPAAEEAMHEGVTFEYFVQLGPTELPAAPAGIGLYRIMVEPGASDEIEAGQSAELVYVESGALTFLFAGPVLVMTDGAPGAPAPQEEITLAAGDAFQFAPGASFSVRNDGSEPAQALSISAFPLEEEEAAVDGTPMAEEEMAGFVFQPLAFGIASDMPAAPAVIGLARVHLAPGASAPPEEPHPGPEIVFLESGTVSLTVTEGEANVLRAADIAALATPGVEPGPGEMATIDEEITGNAGDVLIAQTGSVETIENVGDEPAVAVIAFFAPAEEAHEEGMEAEHTEAGTPVP